MLCLLDQLRLPFVADLKDVVDQDSVQCAAPTSGARLLQQYIHGSRTPLAPPGTALRPPQVRHPYQAKSGELLGVVGFDLLKPGQRSPPLVRGSLHAGTLPHLESASPL